MKKIKITRRTVIAIGITCVALLSCYLVVDRIFLVVDYGGGMSIEPRGEIDVSVYVDCHTKHVGYPYVFMFSVGSPPPFDLDIMFFDPSNRAIEARISQLQIIYSDGETVDVVGANDGWRKNFEQRVSWNSSSGEVSQSTHAIVKHKFSSAIRRVSAFAIQIEGSIALKDGTELAIKKKAFLARMATPRDP